MVSGPQWPLQLWNYFDREGHFRSDEATRYGGLSVCLSVGPLVGKALWPSESELWVCVRSCYCEAYPRCALGFRESIDHHHPMGHLCKRHRLTDREKGKGRASGGGHTGATCSKTLPEEVHEADAAMNLFRFISAIILTLLNALHFPLALLILRFWVMETRYSRRFYAFGLWIYVIHEGINITQYSTT